MLSKAAPADRAKGEVGSDDERYGFGEATAGVLQQERLVRMMIRLAHRSSFSAFLSRSIASRRRDFTVPSGSPRSEAITLCGLSSK